MDARDFIRRLWVLMLTVFVDMIGFLIVLPLLPFYAERLGASPFQVGALVSIFAAAQLASAPLWGRLSDRYGRRPMILGGLVISAISYLLFESAATVALLFLSRFVQGMGAGTVGVVQAYLSDSVPSEDRAKALGWLTAATSAGVMMGPAIGSLAATWGVIGPGYLAAILCVLNFLFAWHWLPESSSGQSSDEPRKAEPGAARKVMLAVMRHPRSGVGAVIWVYALGMMAFMAMNAVLALYLERRFGIDEKTIGWFFVYVGGVSLIMRTVILGPMVRRFGEVGVMRLGAVSMALALASLPFSRNIIELGLTVLLMPVGTALLFPTTTSLVSAGAADHQRGLMHGVQQAFGGVARMVGPIWAGIAFQHVGIRSPFWIAAAVMLFVRFFAMAVPAARKPDSGSREIETVAPSDPA